MSPTPASDAGPDAHASAHAPDEAATAAPVVDVSSAAATIASARTALGIELGSTRIKACLVDVDDPSTVLAVGAHDWENAFVDARWTYALDDVWSGLRAAYADLVDDAERRHGIRPMTYGAIGVSAMMHGYLAFDASGELLVPFRTWRNTSTGVAAAELSALFGTNIPLRWSIAHLHQALLDDEPHVADVTSLTTLAGHVHERLTGRRVLGVGDASGMLPIDAATGDWDERMLSAYDARAAEVTSARADAAARPPKPLRTLLPEVLWAGADAGTLTVAGAALLDPTGALTAGIPLAPPEGDAGTGMVATNAVAPRTGNVSAGTSIFAMVVLEHPLATQHAELDLVTTPAGDPVAMVHANNGASELGAWAGVFGRFAAASGHPLGDDEVFATLLREADEAPADAAGITAYNLLAGEPILGLDAGRPLVVRAPGSALTLGTLVRAELSAVFSTLALGMRVLDAEHVGLDAMYAHGGMFRTEGVAQRVLAAALGAPVSVAATASEGGAWGMAVLAAYVLRDGESLADYLDTQVFARTPFATVEPDADDATGFAAYLARFEAGIPLQRAAVRAIPTDGADA